MNRLPCEIVVENVIETKMLIQCELEMDGYWDEKNQPVFEGVSITTCPTNTRLRGVCKIYRYYNDF